MDLTFFLHQNILESGKKFFKEILSIDISPATTSEIKIKDFIKDFLTDEKLLDKVADARFIGIINDLSIEGKKQEKDVDSFLRYTSEDYDMLLVFGIELKKGIIPSKSDISRLTRALNRRSLNRPVVMLIRYSNFISFSAAERGHYQRREQKGEKVGRISILRDINLHAIHSGHERILLQLRINPLKVSSFKELYEQWLDVFNISILNKEFYNELFTWYLWAVRSVSFPNKVDDEQDDTIYNSENVIRLLTRLIFVWFVREKRLIPDNLFDKIFLSDILKHFIPEANDNSDYYKAILQNLFFATLNTEMPKDGGSRQFLDKTKIDKNTGYTEEYMDHLAYRHKELFIEPDNALKLFENIPFLNGGLFECLDRRDPETNEEIRIDGFSIIPKKQPVVPNILFFGTNNDLDLSNEFEDGKKHKHSKARGIINILNSYKFTIEENTPLEQEIALDPELLGKIFENLLASFNPETKTTARKQTGSYYTPREIVNYMVDESLIAYLKTRLTEKSQVYRQLGNSQTNMFGNKYKAGQLDIQIDLAANKWEGNEDVLETRLRELLSYENEGNPFEGDNETANAIIAHLSECKILDPACGSGAFPMGILHKMVFALGKLDPCNYTWKQAQLEKAFRDKHRAEQFEDENLRAEALKNAEQKIHFVEASFGETGHELDYARKLFLIENCIYGVDIQQIAVQISKLRFFISLMVDQKVDENKPNRNILSLPNLETKFVAANTLIPVDKPQQLLLKDPDLEKTEKELHEIHHKIFFTRNYTDKKKLKKKELEIRRLLRKSYIEKAGYSKEASEEITRWNPFDPLKAAPFFDPEVMFTIEKNKDGGFFDIVIGNPPYIQLQKDKGKLARELKHIGFETFEMTGDIYALFYEKSFQILRSYGILTFITSSQWMKAAYGKSLRKFFLKRNPLKLILLGPGVFENTTIDTNILIAQNVSYKKNLKGIVIENGFQIINISEAAITNMSYVSEISWTIIDQIQQSIKSKIEKNGKQLKDWNIEIYRGILTGYNEAFIIDHNKRDELITKDPKSDEIIKPILRGRGIEKYYTNWDGFYLINTHNGVKKLDLGKIEINEYSTVRAYLDYFGNHLVERKDQGDTPYNLRNCAYLEAFNKEKTIWKRIGSQLRFSYSDSEIFCLDSTCIAIGEKIKYLTALLNSKLCNYQLFENSPRTGMGDLIISVQALEPLFVHYPIPQEEDFINKLVALIINAKKNDSRADTSRLENTIDLMVYKMNTLDYEECKIIDPEIEKLISRDYYENSTIEKLAELNIRG